MATLVGRWNFEQTSGTGTALVLDSSGNGYHGTLQYGRGALGGGTTQGNIATIASVGGGIDGNNCFNFPADSYRVTLDQTDWNGTGFPAIAYNFASASISAVIKPYSTPNSTDVTDYLFFISDYNTQQNQSGLSFVSGDASEGKISFYVATAATNRVAGLSNNTISYDQWHHIVLTHLDGTGFVLYVDGAVMPCTYSVGSASTQYWLNNFTSAATTACWGGGISSQYPGYGEFTGKMDDCRFYNGALTASEVQALAASYSLGFAPSRRTINIT